MKTSAGGSSLLCQIPTVLISITDPLGRLTSYQYDALGRQVTIVQPDPDGSGPLAAAETTYAYDAAGNLASVTDALNHTTTYTYDSWGWQTSVTDPLNGVVSFTYDAWAIG
jgi:YD repeat-containing protein